MKKPAKKAGRSSASDVKVSFLAARRPDGKAVIVFQSKGKMLEQEIDETSDPALGLHEKLKKSKGRDGFGKLLYTDSALFLRPKTNRRLHFQ
jgi:hypothetical protein